MSESNHTKLTPETLETERVKAVLAAIPQRWGRQAVSFIQAATVLAAVGAFVASKEAPQEIPRPVYIFLILLSFSMAAVYHDDESAAWITDQDLYRKHGITIHPERLRRFRSTKTGSNNGGKLSWVPTPIGWMAYCRTLVFFWPLAAVAMLPARITTVVCTIIYLVGLLYFTCNNIKVHREWCEMFDDQQGNEQARPQPPATQTPC